MSNRAKKPSQGHRATAQANGNGIRVIADRREPPDLELFVAALLSLAMKRVKEREQEEEHG